MEENMMIIKVHRMVANASCTTGIVSIEDTGFKASTLEQLHPRFMIQGATRLMGCLPAGTYELRYDWIKGLYIKGKVRPIFSGPCNYIDTPTRMICVGKSDTPYSLRDDQPLTVLNQLIKKHAALRGRFSLVISEENMTESSESYESWCENNGFSDEYDDDDELNFIDDDYE